MNDGIRRVAAVMVVLFLALVAQLTYLQVAHSDKLANDPHNGRKFLRDATRDGGPIVSADGVIVARSQPTNDEFKHQRVYPAPTAMLFAQIVGYETLQNGSSGVERTYSDYLAGRNFKLQTGSLADVFATRQPVGTVVLTVSNLIQQVAANGLAGRTGSVVALDIQSGAIVAAYSNPTYDPNLLANHNTTRVDAVLRLLNKAQAQPLLPHAWGETYPPGSTFKTVTASIALQNQVDVNKQFPFVTSIPLPLTNGQSLGNFGGERCGGSLLQGFIVSCNTTFGQVGLDLGEQLATGVQNFGIETAPPPSEGDTGIDPPIAKSHGPIPGTFQRNQPSFMKDAIGQQDTAVTPLEMALVAESIARGGTIVDPYLVQCVKDPDDRVVKRANVSEYKRAIDQATADTMKTFMLGVVNDPNGTGGAARIPGVQVAGKTGTAETSPGSPPHAWFIEFAPADNPRYAVAVFVDHGGSNTGTDAVTGGRVAAPIAKQVMEALLTQPSGTPQCP